MYTCVMKSDWHLRVRAIREAMKLTQDEFASVLGFKSGSSICHLEAGDKEPRGPLLRILQALERNPRIFSK